MTSLQSHAPTFDFDQDASPTRLINDTQVDSQIARLYARDNAILDILNGFFRSDDTPVDEHVLLRHLSDEIRLALASRSGWHPKASVDLATVGNITLSGEQAIDGTTTSLSRVLVKNQSDASENGIYDTKAGAWTRATDADTANDLSFAYLYVAGGTTNGGTYYLLTTEADDITLDITDLVWVLAGGIREISGSQVFVGASTVSRSISAILGDVVNVKNYGAMGDGVTNDTTTINDAIVDAELLGLPLFFPPGTYLTNGGHVIAESIAVLGSGRLSVIRSTDTGATLFSITGSHVEVAGIHFQGAASAFGELNTALDFNNATGGGSVRECRFSGTSSTTAFYDAIRATQQDSLAIANNVVERIWYHHVYVIDGEDVVIADNVFIRDAALAGSYGRVSVIQSAQVLNNILKGSTIGVLGAAYAGNSAIGNVLIGVPNTNDYIGIDMQGSASIVNGNILATNGGIRVAGSADIVANTVVSPLRHGIDLQGSGASNTYTVRSNRVKDAGQATLNTYSGIIASTTTVDTITIAGNTIQGATQPKYAIDVAAVSSSASVIDLQNNVLTTAATGRFNRPTANGVQVGVDSRRELTVTWDYSGFAAAAVTKDLTIATLPKGWKIKSVFIKHGTAFAGGGLTTYTISVGITGNVTKYAAAFDVFQAVGGTVFQDSNTIGVESMTADTNLVARATGSGNTNLATDGVVTFHIEMIDLGAA